MTLATDAPADWMSANRLRLRLTNTQNIWLGTRQQRARLDLIAIASNFPNNYYLVFAVTVRDLGLGSHTGSGAYLCSSVHTSTTNTTIALPDVPTSRTISRSLTSTAIPTLVHAFITARLYYCFNTSS